MKRLKFIIPLVFTTVSLIYAQDTAEVEETVQDTVVETEKSERLWQDDFKRAQKIAKKKKRSILIFFTGSDWCGQCKMLVNDFFESKEFKKIAKENFVLYKADFPRKNKKAISDQQRKKNAWLSTMYDVNSYPTIVLIDAEGEEIDRIKGYTLLRETNEHFKFVKKNIK